MRRLLITVAAALCTSCYAHGSQGRADLDRPPAVRPALPAAVAGTFGLFHREQQIGIEHFRIVSTSTTWRLEGETRYEEVASDFSLVVDPESAEPTAVAGTLAFGAQKFAISGQRTGPFFEFKWSGVGSKGDRGVAYAKGTAIRYQSPLFFTWLVALLDARLEPGKALAIRTIQIDALSLAPSVHLVELLLRDESKGVKRIEVLQEGMTPVGLWMKPGGVLLRARHIDGAGRIIDRRPIRSASPVEPK